MGTNTLILGGIAAFAVFKMFESAASAQGPVLGPSPGNSNLNPFVPSTQPAAGAKLSPDGLTYTLPDGRILTRADYIQMMRRTF